ncbi:DUF3040 domain-containing protein [Nocardioides dongkuii]|uniref:DUF3040 domain-containing protein n=1 Tax=Nocardioides dongkuii TaxID=2760089 RepID=UPI0015F9121D|nr:DUF3040 domain-containing protein [Nocardioides dongkuii]
MPLSEEELRLLEQMERALVEEDPKFASTLRGTSLRRTARRRAIAAGAVFVLGVCVLMAGAITNLWVVGIAGFVVMLGSATIALNAIRGQQAAAAADASRTAGHPSHGFTVIDGGRRPRRGRQARAGRSTSGSFMERIEERWRRRREENGGF